jgi:excisionase family DNA binding protein
MDYTEKPVRAEVHDGMLWVALEDQRMIAVPITWYPVLAQATTQQQRNVEFSAEGLHWPDIDEDISVRGMMRGCDGFMSTLDAVMTVKEVADTFGISQFTVHDAIKHDWLPARKSGGTYLIRRHDANRRWGKKKMPAAR